MANKQKMEQDPERMLTFTEINISLKTCHLVNPDIFKTNNIVTLALISCPEPSTVNRPQIGNLSCEVQAGNSGLLSGVCLVCLFVCAHSRKMGFATTWILVAKISVITVGYFLHYFLMENPVGRSHNANAQFLMLEDSSWWCCGERGQPCTRWQQLQPLLNPVSVRGPPGEGCVIDEQPPGSALQAWLQPLPTAFLSSKALG